MTITELSILKLDDAATFNPMAILELLRQMVATCSHIAGTNFKAYQEKEDYSRFYIIGGWWNKEKYEQFVQSETYKKLWQLLDTTLKLDSVELLQLSSDVVTGIKDPIVAVQRYAYESEARFANEIEAGLSQEAKHSGGFAITSQVYIAFQGLKAVPKANASLQDIDSTLQSMSLDYTVRHIEVNQFI